MYLSVKELMIVLDKDLSSESQYESTRRAHKRMRDSIQQGIKKLTVRAYCKIRGLDYNLFARRMNRMRFPK